MKKKYWLLALIIPILLVTGCSEESTTKSLSCTMKDGIEELVHLVKWTLHLEKMKQKEFL